VQAWGKARALFDNITLSKELFIMTTKAIESLSKYSVNTIDQMVSHINSNHISLKEAKQEALYIARELEWKHPIDDNRVISLLKSTEIVRTKKAMVQGLQEISRLAPAIIYQGFELEDGSTCYEVEKTEDLDFNDIKENGLQETKEMKEETKDDKALDTAKLDELAKNIKENIETAQSCFLSAGKSLDEANEIIKASGGKQKDFVAWALENVGIKKAQAYNLIKVWKAFGDDSDFAFCSMRVLYILSKQSDSVIEAAREEASDKGKLETKDVYRIIKDVENVDKTPKPQGKPVESSTPNKAKETTKESSAPVSIDEEIAEENKALKAEIEALRSGEVEVIGSQDTQLIEEIQELKAANDMLRNGIDADGSADDINKDMEIDSLKQTIKELQTVIETLRETTKEAITKESSVSAPYLPQFDSKNMAVRLGLEPEFADTKAKVNKAYRALAKIYTKAANEAASIQLKEARDTLLAG
jgi:hypothetical protein